MHRLASLLSSLIPIVCFSQVNIVNRSLTDTLLNYVYEDVQNKIFITGITSTKSIINLKTSGGTITKNGSNEYILTIEDADSVSVTLTQNNKVLIKKKFTVRGIPEPWVRVGGIRDSAISISQILAVPFLMLDFVGCYYKTRHAITSFNALFIGQHLDSIQTFSGGNLFSEQQIKYVKQLKEGDRIYFDKIYAVGPDGRRRKLKSFTIILK